MYCYQTKETLKQTKNKEVRQALKEKLGQIKVEKIRSGEKSVEEFKDFLSDINAQLKGAGMDSYERAQYISEEIFGSPHTA